MGIWVMSFNTIQPIISILLLISDVNLLLKRQYIN